MSRGSRKASEGEEAAPRMLRPAQLLGALHRRGVAFVVIGGYSLAAHGYIRATKDIDIVPDPDGENLSRLADALKALQARVDLGDIDPDELGIEPDAAGLASGGNWVLQTRFGRLDVMQDVRGVRDYEHLRAGAVNVRGTLFAGYEDLISMKSASGRPEDLRDIAAVQAARSEA